jgi:hypothetical protein
MAWHQRLADQLDFQHTVQWSSTLTAVGRSERRQSHGVPDPEPTESSAIRMTAMASIRLVSGGQTEVPNDARLTDRGIEWLDDDGVHHVVPWTAVVEFIGPPPTPPTPMVEKM